MTTISDIARWIEENDRFALMAHVRPDGDSLGSTLALRLALLQLGKQAFVVYPEPVPDTYRFLPGVDQIVDENHLPFEPQCAIVIDVAEENRLGRAAEVLHRVSDCAVIDHHEVKDCAMARNVIRPGAAAAGELIFELIRALGATLTKDVATCLFTAMSTDTGHFNFSNTTPETLRYCADCVAAGVDVSGLTRVLFRLRTPRRVKLLALGLDAIEYHAEGKLALTRITRDMFETARAVHSDADRIVNFLMDTEGVYVAILAEDAEDGTKFSFRSIGSTDVAALARQVGGGGHEHASGATIHLPMDEAVQRVLDVFLPAARAIQD